MLPKKNRVGTKEVAQIFKGGRSLSSPSLSFKYFKNNDKEVKISFIAPKSLTNLAVTRNRLRRCGYSALEKCITLSPLGITGVFVFKKFEDSILILSNEIKNIFSKIN